MDWKARQNSDGGWAYGTGPSWTEPTALVLLAQSAAGIEKDSFDAGIKFLRSITGLDGGYRPAPPVRESTWVTALVALLPVEAVGAKRYSEGIEWLKGQTGRESAWSYKLRQRIGGNPDEFPDGWPWFPGAAAWVIPTSLGIVAFERARQVLRDGSFDGRIEAGRRFLFSRMCADGGWNHGSSKALGRDGDSYPETTGIGLLAFTGAPPSPGLDRAKAAARRHVTNCRTAEGMAWLRMGLAAHGETVSAASRPVCRTTADYALTAISFAPRNPLLSLRS